MELLALCLLVFAVFLGMRASGARNALEARLERLEGELAQLRIRLELVEGVGRPRPPEVPPAPVATRPVEAAAAARPVVVPPPVSATVERRTDTPEPTAPARSWTEWLPGWAQRLMGANTLVRTGVLVLFFGVAFLLKWVTERVTFPIEARLAAVAIGGLALAAVGWRLRLRRPGYGLSLQGGGIGLFYIAIYAAAKIYHLLPPVVALGLMLAVVGLAAALAIAQNALPLALLGAAGGFLAPVLISTGVGDHRLLLGYYVLLNLGILALAFVKTWRPLNLLGFGFTFGFLLFGMGTFFRYEHFWSTAPFVWVLFAMYVAVAVFYARHRSLALAHYVDGTIVFGTPLAVGLLHQRSLEGAGDSLAGATATFGVVYLALAWLVGRKHIVPGMRLLGEAFLGIGVVFLTLAVPLYFGGRATSALWALEGAAIVWVSVRQRRLAGQGFGALLQVAAGISFAGAFLLGRGDWTASDAAAPLRPLLNTDFLGFLVLALAGFIVARQLLRSSLRLAADVASPAFFWWALAWAVLGIAHEIDRFVPEHLQLSATVGVGATGAALLMWTRRRLDWPIALHPVMALLPFLFVAGTLAAIRAHPLADGGYLAWPLAFAVQLLFLARLDREPGAIRHAAPACHVATLLAIVAFVQVEARWFGREVLGLSQPTAASVYLAVLAAVLFATTLALRAGLWPFRAHPRSYLLGAGGVLVAVIALALFGVNLVNEGTAWRGHYLPLLNPVDLASVAALAAVVVWQRAVWRSEIDLPYERRVAFVAFGAAAFFVINCMLLRALHHWAGTPYGDGMLGSTLVQTVLTVFWTVLSVVAMVVATRTIRRLLWLIGAGLLGVVVVKLFVFDLATLRGLQRIVAFLVVGLLLLAIGYFSPVPPRAPEETPQT